LDGGAEIAVHVDADTDVHASLADAVEPARRHGIVLSPHFLAPPPADGLSPDEFEKQRTGVFNSGFVAVGRAGVPFLAWWSSRVARDCLFDDPMGAHADQRWLDYVPSYFDHHVCRDAGVNVAQWNVAERPIGWDGSAYTAGGRPLRSFHFAGFDPDRPDTPGAYGWATPLRLDAVEQPALQRLCREYAGKLLAAGLAEARATRYRYATTAAGTPLDAWRRRAYRELLLAAEAQGADIPDPFDAARSLELERLLARPARSGLLSPAARARLRDARLVRPSAHGGAVGRAEFAVAFARQTWRQLPRRRHPWMPHPLPSARVRLEYASPGPA
ncbi:MAG TPA: hypothetical protein VHB30_12915, partial [Solirubrobacteraceae bacterium]|nr:hypothetical protein [Solirubrobacteraceae bacterium]